MVPPLAAVTVIVIVIVLLLVLNRPGHHTSNAGPVVHPPPSATTTQPAATTPSVKPSPKPTPKPTPKPRRTAPVAEPPATAKPAVAKVPVTVLNNSRRTGLAHRAAAQVANGGWSIKQIGNFTGRIRVSTVYYAPGQARVARKFAHQFSAVQRVLPRFRGLPGSGLTLVVTREWPA
jgi:hypothetical protein